MIVLISNNIVPYLEWTVLVNERSSIDDARGNLGDGDRPGDCIGDVKI